MEIQLHSTRVNTLHFEASHANNEDSSESPSLGIDFKSVYMPKDNKVFGIRFIVKTNQPNNFKLELDYVAWFRTLSEIDEEFKSSDFTKINAPAIAFPYLRAFVSTIILNSGFEPLVLPTINFVKLHEHKKHKVKM